MKLLFATVALDGHVNPLLPLAVHLRSLGHDVRWYTGPAFEARLERLGIPLLPFHRARAITGAGLPELFPERARLKGPALLRFDFEQVFLSNTEAYFLDIQDIAASFPFDALVCDTAFLGARLVHDVLGKHVVGVGVAPSIATGPGLPPNFSGLRPARTRVGRAAHRLLGRAMEQMVLAPGKRRYDAVLAAHGLPPVVGSMYDEFALGAYDAILQTGVPGLDHPRVLDPRVTYIGAPLPPEADAAAPHLLRGRAEGQPLVLVSQGTVDNEDPGKLLVPTIEALAPTGALVVAATGGRHTQALRERFPLPNVVIEDWVPFGAVLPATDLLVSNGGFGSVLLSLAHGVPLVVAGIREGKNDINVRVAAAGAGIDLRTEAPTAARIARAAEKVLGESTYRESARRLREEFGRYDPLRAIDEHLAAALPDAWERRESVVPEGS